MADTEPYLTQWGVLLDDLGSMDIYNTRREAVANLLGGALVRVDYTIYC